MGTAPPGPLTVEFVADGSWLQPKVVHFQLYRKVGNVQADHVRPDARMAGRTLVYAEEFDHPLSISRTGIDADYAAGKPVIAARRGLR